MDRIVKLRQILDKPIECIEGMKRANEGTNWYLTERYMDELTKQIDQLYHPEPQTDKSLTTGSRLLTREQLKDAGVEVDEDSYNEIFTKALQAQHSLDQSHYQEKLRKVANDLSEMLLVEERINFKAPIIQYLNNLKGLGK